MDAETHPDPFRDAMQHGLHRAVQMASCAVTAGQVYIYQQKTQARTVTERDERTRRALQAQARAERETARTAWAPALDPAWLNNASLIDSAQAWSAATPYADKAAPWYEPAAATAMRKCEDRLRQLHPYAMARYDRLRADGIGPAEAMREAAPLFARAPHAHDAPSVPRPALSAGNGGPAWTASQPGYTTRLSADAQVLERRGRQILEAIQDRAGEQGRRPLGPAEQRTVLEAITSLPPEIINRVVKPTAAGNVVHGAPVRTAKPWQQDFPLPIREVVASAARASSGGAAPSAASPTVRKQETHRGQRP